MSAIQIRQDRLPENPPVEIDGVVTQGALSVYLSAVRTVENLYAAISEAIKSGVPVEDGPLCAALFEDKSRDVNFRKVFAEMFGEDEAKKITAAAPYRYSRKARIWDPAVTSKPAGKIVAHDSPEGGE